MEFNILNKFADWVVSMGGRIIAVIILLIIGFKLIRLVRNILSKSMEKAGMEPTLRKFLDALTYALMLGALAFMTAEGLGIKATSIVTIFGSVTLALGLAMQDSLSNFAGGVMILMLHPFKVGDYISAADGSGTVESIGLVYTTIMTVDNQKIVIPNSKLSSSTLTNTSAMETRRLILTVPISYNADIKKAKEIVRGILEEYPAIINDEGILVVVDSLGDSGVNLSIRGWVKNADYWQAKWDLTEAIKLTFDEKGIEIPYQHVVVQVKTKE